MKSFHQLDKLLDSRVRLAVMSMLLASDWIDFSTFKEELQLSDGNLASHLRKLEDAQYVELRKGFVGRKALSSYRVTEIGRKQFEIHIKALADMMDQHR